MEVKQCPHDVFLEGKCTSCKIHKSDCQDVTTVPLSYLRPGVNVCVTLSTIDRFRDQDLRVVLGQKKLNLILDLDNTLLHAKIARKLTLEDKQRIRNDSSELYTVVEKSGSKLVVKLRPGVREFLKKASEMFELSIYTMATREYAHTMANLLALGSNQDGRSMFKNKIVSREDCTKAGQKGLDVLLSDRRVVLVVDDREDVWEESCRANVIKIAPYRFFEDEKRKRGIIGGDEKIVDDELNRVLSKLSLVHQMFYEDNNGDGEYMKRDVRRVLERVRDHEEEKKKDDEELAQRKRLEVEKARRFIERFCAPVTNKRCKRDSMMGSVSKSPCLV